MNGNYTKMGDLCIFFISHRVLYVLCNTTRDRAVYLATERGLAFTYFFIEYFMYTKTQVSTTTMPGLCTQTEDRQHDIRSKALILGQICFKIIKICSLTHEYC